MKKDRKDVEKDILKNVGKFLSLKRFYDIFNGYTFYVEDFDRLLNYPLIAKLEMVKYSSINSDDVEHDFTTYHVYCRNLETNEISDIAIATNEQFEIRGIFCKK